MTAKTQARRRPGLAKRIRYALDAALVYGLAGFFRLFDLDTASNIGGWFGRNVLNPLLGDKASRETIAVAFPELDDAGRRRLARDMWDNIGRNLAEIAQLERFAGDSGKARFTFEGLEHLEEAMATGKPPIMVSGHFSNWELAFVAANHSGLFGAGITRPPNNPWVAEFIAERRRRVGFTEQIPKGKDGTRRLFAVLRQGRSIGLLIDQRLDEGIPVPLFGTEAMTTHAPATFARKLGLPIVPLAVRRTKGAHFHAVWYPVVYPTETENSSRDILEMTATLNRFVEAEVRAAPGHWLWMHPRFRRRRAELSRRAGRVVGEASEASDIEESP